jgi:choline monooxygenase
MPVHFPFDASIASASTIPSRLYTDAVYLELEQERIFGRTWQLVGRAEQVAESGQFFTVDVAGEGIVILRDGETLRGFHNVCLHRAGMVAVGCGKRKTLQCHYHGWTYNLQGGLIRAPEMEGVERFSMEEMHLKPVQVAQWGPLVFANLDLKAPPLAEFLEDIPDRARHFRIDEMRYVMRREYVLSCNWKVYIDNYLEGYHIPVVHPGLHKEIAYDQYQVEPHRYYSLQHAPLRPVAGNGEERNDRRSGAILLAVPKHHAQRVPGPDADERDPAARRRSHVDDLRVVFGRSSGERGGGRDVDSTAQVQR